MTDKQLPRQQKKRRRRQDGASLFGWFMLAYIMFVLSLLLAAGTTALIAGETPIAIGCAITFGFLVWSSGSLFVTIPLSNYLAASYRDSTEHAKIDLAHTRALKMLTRLPLRRRADVGSAMCNLGLLRLCQGHYESAESLFAEAADYLRSNKRLYESVSAVIVHNNRAFACIRLSKYIEAELHATKALEIAQSPKVQKGYQLIAAAPLAALGSAQLRSGDFSTSLENFSKSMKIYETTALPLGMLSDSIDQAKATCCIGLATVNMKLGNRKDADNWCDRLFASVREEPVCVNTLSIEPLNLLANEYMNAKAFDRAEQLLELSYCIAREHPFHPDSRQLLNFYEKLFLLTGRQSEVPDMRSWLRDVEPLALAASG